MIYRLVVDECLQGEPSGQGRLGGLMNSHHLSSLMDELGIRAPGFDSKKARFYFTEAGWRQAGRILAAEARQRGHVVRCIRRKNPLPSQIVYQDEYQVAILPARRKGKGRRD